MIRTLRNVFGLLAVCSALLVLNGSSVRAQDAASQVARKDTSKSTFGILIDAALNEHRANFQTLPDIPNCCPLFQSGNGYGYEGGLFYDYDAFGEGHIGVRAGISSLNGTLKAAEPMIIAVGGQPVVGNVDHTIAAQFTVASLEPYYAYDLGHLRLMIGASAGFILASTYNQAETITEPTNEGVFFPSETRTRNVYSGNIPDAATLRIGLIAGAQYPLPLNESGSLHLIPEISFDYGLTQMVSGLSWSVNALRAGASIGYTPITTIEPPPPPPPPAPPPPPRPTLFVGIKAYSILNGVRDSSNLSVAVEEFYSTTQTPLLPFVLFGLDSSAIPSRYHSLSANQTAGWDIRKTDSTDNVRVYHDILNIIGKRMREHPKAQLTLTGCTSNEPEETADNGLAITRADNVAIYIENTWGISPTRITLEKRGLPEKPSSLTQQEGKEENRRVEISASDPAILAPVFLADTQLTTNPPGMEFVPSVQAQAGVQNWDMYVTQPVMTLYHEHGTGTKPKTWDWDLSSVSAKIPRTEDTIEYGLTITDSAGREETTIGTIPVRQKTISKKRLERVADTVIERYTLVLFDFGSAKIDPQNRAAIDYIHNQLTPKTVAYITGYADRTGEDAIDQQLTEDRASAVAKLLGAKDYVSKGVGKSKLLFDNNIPEGRFYSRTVNITLFKPINQ
jgi:outer membrane protein OmpA-like peptidoglycan-associated protein